jgi:hypothetical protein
MSNLLANFRKNVPSILGNNAPNNKYIKPQKGAGIYTLDELKTYGLKWELVCIKRGEIIDAFAELVINNRLRIIEIFNVYTHPTVRRMGRASVLLNAVKRRYPEYTLWLGIRPESRAVNNSKAALYGRLNFTSNIKITNTTPSGKKLPFKFIQLVFKPNKMRNNKNRVTKVKNKIETLSSVKEHAQISIVVTIPSSYLQAVKRFTNINVPTETGGTIAVRYVGFSRGVYEFEGQSTPSRTNPGFIGNQGHAVQIPPIDVNSKHLITWHTHPKVCYQLYKACLGLPSIPDFMFFFRNYIERPRELCTLVFATEAIYVIYIKRGIKKAILLQNAQTKEQLYNNVSQQLQEILQPIHTQEMNPLSPNQKIQLIDKFNAAINRITVPINGVPKQVFKMETKINKYGNDNGNVSRGSNLNAYGNDLVLKIPYDVDFLQNAKRRT